MKIRLPISLKQRIEAAARAGNRSLNGEILLRLERSLDTTLKESADEKASILEAEIETLRAELRQHDTRISSLEKK